MMNFTPELVEKAKAAQTAEELLSLAKAAGVEMTAAEAAAYFAQLNPKSGELDDDDRDNVAGGSCGSTGAPDTSLVGTLVRVTTGETCKKCGGNVGIINIVDGGYSYKLVAECQNDKYMIAYLGNDGSGSEFIG